MGGLRRREKHGENKQVTERDIKEIERDTAKKKYLLRRGDND
jgi:hypothetical protein